MVIMITHEQHTNGEHFLGLSRHCRFLPCHLPWWHLGSPTAPRWSLFVRSLYNPTKENLIFKLSFFFSLFVIDLLYIISPQWSHAGIDFQFKLKKKPFEYRYRAMAMAYIFLLKKKNKNYTGGGGGVEQGVEEKQKIK